MKTKTLFTIVFITFFSSAILAQESKKELDKQAIKNMCGCYEVKFNFAETFSYADSENYEPSEIKRTGGLEWVQLVEDEEDKIVMQHLLMVGPENKQTIVKHWRQDWLYENTDLYVYDVDNAWKFVKKDKAEVAGQWTQKVFQVDDSPRYEGTASWVHVDGKSYWENTTDAPLPRREFTKRNDYNVTVRTNRHEITNYGWLHEQDNDKVIRKASKEDVVLAQEKGFNTYTKVDDAKCLAAQNWWKENEAMWGLVRKNWDNVFAKQQDIKLKSKVEGKRLFEHLFSLENTASKKEVKSIIQGFLD